MALSVPPLHTSWDRTLPNPAALLPNGIEPRRTSSLLQHHISSNQFLTPAADESGRRSTVPCLPRPKDRDLPHGEEDVIRSRQASVMSVDSLTESSSEGTSPQDTTSEYCLCRPDPKIPRPRNAFILYRQNQHADVVKAHPGLPNPDISKIIGEQWRCLSIEEKDKWKAFAEQEKARHSQQFPDYRYRPKRSAKHQAEGPTQASQPTTCSKCGGKTMNPPHTPHYSSFDHPPASSMSRPQKRPYPEAHIQSRAPSLVQVAAAPHTAPLVRHGYQTRHDSVQYVPPAPQHLPQHMIDSPDTKRRRIDSVYSARPAYDHQYYDRERVPQQHYARHPMAPPLHQRTSHPLPPSAGVPRPVSAVLPRRDPSLTLPPLKTGAPRMPSIAANQTTQKSGIEAMIMSYPVLTKLKTLQSITPPLAAPGPVSPPFEVRGAIIAIEGLDQRKVLDMTHTLADQLNKEGKFIVQVFHGPDPYEPFQSSRRASIRDGSKPMTVPKYLSRLMDWHKLGQEMVHFVTHRPGPSRKVEQVREDHQDMPNASAVSSKPKSPFVKSPTQRSPISAVSPMTNSHNEMDIDTPRGAAKSDNSPRVTRSRIPQVFLEAKANEDAMPLPSPVSNRPQPSPTSPSPKLDGDQKNEMTQPQEEQEHTNNIYNLIPVALVPHYQLTTVDTTSITLPITDNYDPLTHWRWGATLWRGCPGPDISVVIKSSHEQHEDDAAESKKPDGSGHGRTGSIAMGSASHPPPLGGRPGALNNDHAPTSGAPPTSAAATTPPAGSVPTPFGVEVRLQDHRAVIVRAAGPISRGSNTSDEGDAEKENENWEKAKRRVGFEVEEWMRR